MSYDLKLAEIDVDGAVRETAAEAETALAGDTRLSFLRKAGVAGGAFVGGGALLSALAPAAVAAGRPPRKFGAGDVGILNYALTLEYLESSFYNEATRENRITDPQTRIFLKTVTDDENKHVAALKKVLGHKAVKKPKFDFKGIPANQAQFQQTAFALENTGVHAYLGQALNIKSSKVAAAALSIVTVEARHASVIGLIVKHSEQGLAPNGAFDVPWSASKVLAAVKKTGFIKQ